MLLAPDSPRRAGEERRYFPDWTDSLIEARQEIEADHNSYLAGGYAEEFGYQANPGSSRGVPLLDGEPPDECPERRGQAAAAHPGYPLKPRPVALDGEPTKIRITAVPEPALLERAPRMEHHGTFIRVTERPYAHERHDAAHRVEAVLMRFLATLIALRRGLPRRGGMW